MNLLLEIAASGASFPAGTILLVVGILGFVAAVTLGSIAWYNSKRPAGWEGAERPDFMPKMGDDSK
ncbi:MAG: hypothetical protein QNJ46_05735 [Leptolyngbyaceae cyanobacterium MO_188.B28]|nr:hypothetical protein [Leptolyngbyaceae cyanobacterium MO_188.B28]